MVNGMYNSVNMATYKLYIAGKQIATVSDVKEVHRLCEENGHPIRFIEIQEQRATTKVEIRSVTIEKDW